MSKVIIESILSGEKEEVEVSLAKDKYSTLSFDIIERMGISPKIHRINGQKEYFCEGLIHPQGNNRPPITTYFHLVPSGNGLKGILVEQVFVEIADPFVVPWEAYLQLPAGCVERLKQRAWEENKNWIKESLEQLCAEWIVVCNREIIKWSNNLRDYPSQEELKEIAQKYNLFPFGFSQPPLIEDTSWYETKYANDYYPTLKINISGNLGLIADLDTGAKNTVLDREQLISHNLLGEISGSLLPATHLDEYFEYSPNKLPVEITDESGKKESKSLTCICVKDWKKSPFCKVNPNRKALVGRDLLLEFPLEIKLNGKEKKTHIYLD